MFYLFVYQGLIPAMKTLFPTVEHRYCVKHIHNNFKVNHKGLGLKDALRRCVVATIVRGFERGMQYMKELDMKRHGSTLQTLNLPNGQCHTLLLGP